MTAGTRTRRRCSPVGCLPAAEYLGHSPAVLLRTYAHLMPADHDRARSGVQAAFTRAAAGELGTG